MPEGVPAPKWARRRSHDPTPEMAKYEEFVEEFLVPSMAGRSTSLDDVYEAYQEWMGDAHGGVPDDASPGELVRVASEALENFVWGAYDRESQRFCRTGIRNEEDRYLFSKFAAEHFDKCGAFVSSDSVDASYRSWMIGNHEGLPSGSTDGRVAKGLREAAKRLGYAFDPTKGVFCRHEPSYREFSEEFFAKNGGTTSLSSLVGAYYSWVGGDCPPGVTDSKVVVGLVEAAELLGFGFDPVEAEFRDTRPGFDEFAKGFFAGKSSTPLALVLKDYETWLSKSSRRRCVVKAIVPGLQEAARRIGFVLVRQKLEFRRVENEFTVFVAGSFVKMAGATATEGLAIAAYREWMNDCFGTLPPGTTDGSIARGLAKAAKELGFSQDQDSKEFRGVGLVSVLWLG